LQRREVGDRTERLRSAARLALQRAISRSGEQSAIMPLLRGAQAVLVSASCITTAPFDALLPGRTKARQATRP